VPRFFATCARGLESILADELRVLAADDIDSVKGGVHFAGDLALLYRANLWLRTAIRVLVPILDGPVRSPDDLYALVKRHDWSQHMTPDHTLAVDANVRDSAITHSKYAALRVKDAICDQFLERKRRRPSVDVEAPMAPLNLHIAQNHMTLSLDSSGDSLHRRGYRPIQTKAPINEALGAGIVMMTGWRGDRPLIDPMCGSGTLCIEAAFLALGRPPGLTRRRFGFMGWLNYDVKLWTRIRDAARDLVRPQLAQPIAGYDVRHDAIAFAEGNAKSAGIGNLLTFVRADIRDFNPPAGPPGIIVCNPPYGERIGNDDDLPGLYRDLGDAIRRAAGWSAYVFASREAPTRAMGIKPKKRTSLFNGKIHCELMEFPETPR
jgi:putative N6-adenine-specific DNA methylase